MSSEPNYFGQCPLDIIFPNSSYQQALDQANVTSLANRRTFLCKNLMAGKRNESQFNILLDPASYNNIYSISVKIEKY